jgi:hypothetical protein
MGSKSDIRSLLVNEASVHGVIRELHEYANLETLSMESVVLTEDEIRTLFTSLAGMRVHKLVLSNMDIVDGKLYTLLPLLAECSLLRELDISNTDIRNPDAIYELLQLPLNYLSLSKVGIGDRGAEKIALAMYQNRTPRILKIFANDHDITAVGWGMIGKALRDNTSLVGLIAGGSKNASTVMTPAIEQNDRLHFFGIGNYDFKRQTNYVTTPGTLRFVFEDDPNIFKWEHIIHNLERLVFARFPVERHAPVTQLALDQSALYQKVALPSLPAAIHRNLQDAISRSRMNAKDEILERWKLGSMFVEWDDGNELLMKIAYSAHYEVSCLEGADFDLIPDARVLYPFRDEILELSSQCSVTVLVHPADTEWQRRLIDATGVAVLVCVPDDANIAEFEALTARYMTRNYSVAIIGNVTSKMIYTAGRYLPNARRVFGAPDVATAIRAEDMRVDTGGYTIRDLLVYHECLASGEMLLTLDDADRIAMRCGFGPRNWARVARFPGVWTLPGVGVAPSAARFVAYLDAWLSPSGAVHATPWRAREGAAFAARLRAFTVSPEHLAKIVRQANELVDVSVDAVVDALAALGVVVRVAGGPLLVVRGRRSDALAALHARLLERPAEFAMVAPRGETIDFVHAGTRYAAGVADGAVKITDVAADRLAPLALRQALLPGPGPARDAPEAKRRAP